MFVFNTGLRKVYPYYFTFTTFTKGRWVGEKILDVFAKEFRAHPVEEYVSTAFAFGNYTVYLWLTFYRLIWWRNSNKMLSATLQYTYLIVLLTCWFCCKTSTVCYLLPHILQRSKLVLYVFLSLGRLWWAVVKDNKESLKQDAPFLC